MPCPTPAFPTCDFPQLKFKYPLGRENCPLSVWCESGERPLFLANMTIPFADTPVEVVVKFTTDYHEKAHRLLADRGLAPKLHGCHPVVGLRGMKMIVMERADGNLMSSLKTGGDKPPSSAYKDVATAVNIIHGSGLVFGDLRTTNILITNKDDEMHALLIDFDWVDEHNGGTYPSFINERLVLETKELHPDVRPQGVMLQEHDV